MSTSTNSVFHYTKTLDNLKNILLSSHFKIKYCSEKIQFKKSVIEIAVPMVSFCDIPLTQVTNLTSEYGTYGIGLKKQWAIDNKINPVLYLSNQSFLAVSLEELYSVIHKIPDTIGKYSKQNTKRNKLINTFRFIKNIEGIVKDKKKKAGTTKKYCFYQEREWRFIPHFSKNYPPIINNNDYVLDKEIYNNKLEGISLKFSYDDISYIILDNDLQVDSFKKYIKKNPTISSIVISKIHTMQAIKEDY